MEYSVKELNSSEREIEIKLDYSEIKSDIEAEVRKQTKKIQLPGFRKGKAPLHLLKKMYGDALEYDASEKVASDFFWKAAKENELKPIGQPSMTEIKFEPNESLNFKILYETIPVINVKDYKNIEIEVPDFKVTEDEVNREIEYLRKNNQTFETAEVVGPGKDFVIEAEIKRSDENWNTLPDIKPEKIKIDLSNPQVHQNIIKNAEGKKAGEEFNFTFDDERVVKNDKGEEENLKETYYYIAKILSISKIVLPELNDELVKKVTKDKVSNVEEFKTNINKDIQRYYDERLEEITRSKFISEIIKKNEFVPPKSLVNNILDEYIKSEEEYAKKNRYPFNQEEARLRLTKSAENEVRWYLIKNEIIKVEDIQISEDDLKAQAEKDSEKSGLPVDKLLSYYKSSQQSERNLDSKLFDFLKEKNKINFVDPDKLYPKKEGNNE